MTTQEDNRNWNKVPYHQRPHTIAKQWTRSLGVHSAHNITNPSNSAIQYGGVSIWAFNEINQRKSGKGVDPTGLGRWGWVKIRGRNGLCTRIYSIYRPCASHSGALTTHAQHITYLANKKDLRTPQSAFMEDLSLELQEAQEGGDRICLLYTSPSPRDGATSRMPSSAWKKKI